MYRRDRIRSLAFALEGSGLPRRLEHIVHPRVDVGITADASRKRCADNRLTTARVEDISSFEALKDEWNELLAASDSDCLFLTWEWLFTWWKHLAEGRSLRVVVVRHAGELVAIAPLALRQRGLGAFATFSTLEFLGSGNVGSDYLDVIVRRDTERIALDALAGDLCERMPVVELSRIGGRGRQAAELGSRLERKNWMSTCATMDSCPFIDLSGHTWNSFMDRLGSAHRYNFRRRLRNLHRRFSVQFEEIQSEKRRRHALPILMMLHHKRWDARGRSDAFHTSSLVAFHEEFSRLALTHGWLRLYILWLDCRPAAALYGFRYGDVFYFYQSGFDPAFGKYSVGLVTMGLVIRRAIEEGAMEYDLLHGREEYKFLWAQQERDLVRLELYPPCARGIVYRRATKLRRCMKKLAAKSLQRTIGDWIIPGRRMVAPSRTGKDPYIARTE